MTDLLQYWFNQIRFIRRMTGGTRQFTIFNFQSLFSFSSLTEACDEWAEQTYKQFLLSFFSNKFKLKRWNYGAVNLEFRTLDHPLRPPSLSQIPSKLQLIVQSAHRHSFWKRNETATTTKKKINNPNQIRFDIGIQEMNAPFQLEFKTTLWVYTRWLAWPLRVNELGKHSNSVQKKSCFFFVLLLIFIYIYIFFWK